MFGFTEKDNAFRQTQYGLQKAASFVSVAIFMFNKFKQNLNTEFLPYTNCTERKTEIQYLLFIYCILSHPQSTRSRPVKLFQSASTEESIEANSTDIRTIPTTSKQPKQRWSVLFGLKNPQQNQLCEILNNYTKNGVPQSKSSTYSFEHVDLPSALEYLENIHASWKEFVCYSNMTDNEIKIQSAIWELVTTEVDYIHALQTVTDVSILLHLFIHLLLLLYFIQFSANKKKSEIFIWITYTYVFHMRLYVCML